MNIYSIRPPFNRNVDLSSFFFLLLGYKVSSLCFNSFSEVKANGWRIRSELSSRKNSRRKRRHDRKRRWNESVLYISKENRFFLFEVIFPCFFFVIILNQSIFFSLFTFVRQFFSLLFFISTVCVEALIGLLILSC